MTISNRSHDGLKILGIVKSEVIGPRAPGHAKSHLGLALVSAYQRGPQFGTAVGQSASPASVHRRRGRNLGNAAGWETLTWIPR